MILRQSKTEWPDVRSAVLGFANSGVRTASPTERWLPCAGMPPAPIQPASLLPGENGPGVSSGQQRVEARR